MKHILLSFIVLICLAGHVFSQIITDGPNKGLTVDQVIGYRVAGIAAIAKKTTDQLTIAQAALTASQTDTKTIQAVADKLQGERDWWQADDAKQVQEKESAQREKQKIASEFHKLLFACASLLAALSVLLVLQLLPVTFVPPPYRWYVAAGVGAVTFAASWAILSQL